MRILAYSYFFAINTFVKLCCHTRTRSQCRSVSTSLNLKGCSLIVRTFMYSPKNYNACSLFLLQTNKAYLNPSRFLSSLGINNSSQQDVVEMRHLLLQKLSSTNPNVEAVVRDRYTGMYRNSIRCLKCQNTKSSEDPFSSLQVTPGPKSLEECISNVTNTELFIGDNKISCSMCNNKQESERKCRLAALPEVLNIQICRLTYDLATGKRVKLKDVVSIPFLLDVAPFSVDAENGLTGPIMYRLMSIVMHSGEENAGHYYLFTRRGAGWILIDDRVSSPVESIEDLSSTEEAYQRAQRRTRKPNENRRKGAMRGRGRGKRSQETTPSSALRTSSDASYSEVTEVTTDPSEKKSTGCSSGDTSPSEQKRQTSVLGRTTCIDENHVGVADDCMPDNDVSVLVGGSIESTQSLAGPIAEHTKLSLSKASHFRTRKAYFLVYERMRHECMTSTDPLEMHSYTEDPCRGLDNCIPESLQQEVRFANEEFQKECGTFQEKRVKLESAIQDHRDAYGKLLGQRLEKPDDRDAYFWIPTSDFANWVVQGVLPQVDSPNHPTHLPTPHVDAEPPSRPVFENGQASAVGGGSATEPIEIVDPVLNSSTNELDPATNHVGKRKKTGTGTSVNTSVSTNFSVIRKSSSQSSVLNVIDLSGTPSDSTRFSSTSNHVHRTCGVSESASGEFGQGVSLLGKSAGTVHTCIIACEHGGVNYDAARTGKAKLVPERLWKYLTQEKGCFVEGPVLRANLARCQTCLSEFRQKHLRQFELMNLHKQLVAKLKEGLTGKYCMEKELSKRLKSRKYNAKLEELLSSWPVNGSLLCEHQKLGALKSQFDQVHEDTWDLVKKLCSKVTELRLPQDRCSACCADEEQDRNIRANWAENLRRLLKAPPGPVLSPLGNIAEVHLVPEAWVEALRLCIRSKASHKWKGYIDNSVFFCEHGKLLCTPADAHRTINYFELKSQEWTYVLEQFGANHAVSFLCGSCPTTRSSGSICAADVSLPHAEIPQLSAPLSDDHGRGAVSSTDCVTSPDRTFYVFPKAPNTLCDKCRKNALATYESARFPIQVVDARCRSVTGSTDAAVADHFSEMHESQDEEWTPSVGGGKKRRRTPVTKGRKKKSRLDEGDDEYGLATVLRGDFVTNVPKTRRSRRALSRLNKLKSVLLSSSDNVMEIRTKVARSLNVENPLQIRLSIGGIALEEESRVLSSYSIDAGADITVTIVSEEEAEQRLVDLTTSETTDAHVSTGSSRHQAEGFADTALR
eukprot:Rmarinus@m.635